VTTEIEVVKSFPIAEQALANLKESNLVSSSFPAEKVIKKLSVEPIVGTDVVALSYKSDRARQGAKIVDEIMETYIHQMLANKRNDVLAAQQIVNEQLPKARLRVKEKEEALQAFKEQYQIFAFDKESQDVITKSNNVENEIKNARVELQEAQTKSEILQKQLGITPQQAIVLHNISQSPKVQQAIDNLSQLQKQIIQKQEFFQDQDPTMASLYNQVEFIEKFLQNEINKDSNSVDRQFTVAELLNNNRDDTIQQELTTSLVEFEQTIPALEKKLTQLQGIRQEYLVNLRDLPKLENEYKDLQLQVEAAQLNYRSFLKSLEEIRSVEQQNLNNVRVIESAQIQESYFKSTIVLTIGIASGIIIAIITMVTLEVTDRTIKTLERLKEILNYPILGTIPIFALEISSSPFKKFVDKSLIQYLPKSSQDIQSSRVNELKPVFSKKSIVELSSEATVPSLSSKTYSMLYAKFKILTEKQSANIITISSSLASEGKSEITANLAFTIANSGQTVLVIDANLHQPAQQRIWQLDCGEGLSDIILNGKMADLFCHRVSNNLDVLLSGKSIENPFDTINSQKLQLLVQNLAQKYDYVLIDSPSLIDNVDALNLGKMSDGILLVAKIGILNNSKAIECNNLLEMTEQNVIGMVINES
jgi:capsular exopolysaccharide synthesis family protein